MKNSDMPSPNMEKDTHLPLIPFTSYQRGTCICVCGHDFVLTDHPEKLREYTAPTAHLTVVNGSHKGTVFLAPDNDMSQGLVQFTMCPHRQQVVPHYWALHSVFEEEERERKQKEIQGQQNHGAPPPAQQSNSAYPQGTPDGNFQGGYQQSPAGYNQQSPGGYNQGQGLPQQHGYGGQAPPQPQGRNSFPQQPPYSSPPPQQQPQYGSPYEPNQSPPVGGQLYDSRDNQRW